jgi:polypeptide N-acetylgalactosaminyltransferase
MLGCVFAIRRDYFFDLGAYDEQFLIWNAENYELSFKLWLCGGQLLEVPCSRVAHTFRKHNEWRKLDGVDFVGHNFKRLAEVWFDEFKETFYKSDPIRYGKIDFGDISREKKIRQDLNCKPFIYMLEVVMPDMVERYPYKDLGIFAKGVIRSEADKNLCVDTLGQSNEKTLGLYQCHRNLTDPPYNQKFIFNWHRQILIVDSYDRCLDTNNVSMGGCHFSLGHQLWIFKPVKLLSDKIQ